jgi:hypothetical protein
MNLPQAADHLDRIADGLERECLAAVAETLDDLRDRAVYQSEGPLTPQELRRLGHPLARRRGTPQIDPHRVNRQSGVFAGSWDTDGPHEDEGGVFGALFNTDPKAPFLEQPDGGPKSTMFPRHPHEAASRDVEPRFTERMDAALVRALEG